MKTIITKSTVIDFIVGAFIVTTLAFHDQTIVMLFFQVLAFCVCIFLKRQIIISSILKQYIVWKLLFVVFSLASFIWALNTQTIISCVISVCQVTICGVTMILYCQSDGNSNKIIKYIILACVLLVLRLLIVVPTNAWTNGERVGQYLGSGNSGGYGNTGVTYVLSIGAIFVFFEAIKKKNKMYYIMTLVFTLFSLLSGSKKAIIIFAVMLILTALLNSKSPRKAIIIFVVAIFATVIGMYAVMNVELLYNSVGIRIEQMMNLFTGGEVDASTSTRVTYLIQAKDMFLQNPIKGVGLDGFRYFNKRLCWAENNMMELLADLGIIGFLMYYWFPILIIIKTAMRRLSGDTDATINIVMLAAFLVIDLTMVTYSQETIQLYFTVISIIAFEQDKRAIYKKINI